MIEIQEYLDRDGVSGFSQWFGSLDTQAALKVTTYLARLENGNTSALKSLGKGLWECRIHWGPGLRIYLGRDGDRLVILFGGGTKRRQSKDLNFRYGLLTESLDAMLSGDLDAGKSLLRDYINATTGFETLADGIGKSPKSLMRMLSVSGNPTAKNLFGIVSYLQQAEGVSLQTRAS